MVEREKIIKAAIRQASFTSPHPGLEAILIELEQLELEQILFDYAKYPAKGIYERIQFILSATTSKYDQNEIASVISLKQKYLNQAFENFEIKSLILFLYLNDFFDFKIDEILTVGDEAKSGLAQKIKDFLIKVGFVFDLLPNAPEDQKRLFNESNEGFQEGNVEKAYSAINAKENSQMGFNFNFVIEKLVVILSEISLKEYSNFLNGFSNLPSIAYFTQRISKKTILTLDKIDTKNKWLLIELIRRILRFEERHEISEEIKTYVYESLKMLTNDLPLINSLILYFHKNNTFNAALGRLLADLPDDQVEVIILDVLPINTFATFSGARTHLFHNYYLNADLQSFNRAIEKVYYKYDMFYQVLLQSEDIRVQVIITDYVNQLFGYFERLSDLEFKHQMNEILNQIIWINSEWFKNQSHLIGKLMLYISKLYFISSSYTIRKRQGGYIDDPEIVSKIPKCFYVFNFNIRVLKHSNGYIDQIRKNLVSE